MATRKSVNNKEPAKDTKAKATQKAKVVAETAPVEDVPKVDVEVEKVTAKAGKRSAKTQKETVEKEAKEARKKSATDTQKTEKRPPRSRIERAGKKFREAAKLVDATKTYPLAEAIDLASKTSPYKFDATVELHVNLGVDPKVADQNIRATVVLPSGSGKTVKVAVLAEGDKLADAKKAGADIAGNDELLADLEKEQIDFDILIASPQLMSKLSKYAKLLGPRGLMPNPKSGTVTTDVAKAVKEAKTGKVEYRSDSSGIIHLGIGKISQGPDKVLENAKVVLASISAARPASLKGSYIKSIYISTTMGPSIKSEAA